MYTISRSPGGFRGDKTEISLERAPAQTPPCVMWWQCPLARSTFRALLVPPMGRARQQSQVRRPTLHAETWRSAPPSRSHSVKRLRPNLASAAGCVPRPERQRVRVAGVGLRLAGAGGPIRNPRCASVVAAHADKPTGERLLVVFAGSPKVGDLGHAAEEFGVGVTVVDILGGGSAHDVMLPEVFDRLLGEVAGGVFTVVWLAPPCSSFSVLHIGRARGRLRTRGRRRKGGARCPRKRGRTSNATTSLQGAPQLWRVRRSTQGHRTWWRTPSTGATGNHSFSAGSSESTCLFGCSPQCGGSPRPRARRGCQWPSARSSVDFRSSRG